MIGTLPSHVRIRMLLITSALIAIGAFIVLLLITDESSFSAIRKAITRLAIITVLISVFWVYVERWGWSHIPKLGKLIRDWPDLNGRWEGTIKREGPDPSHAFVLEITQTLTKLRIDTYTDNGESHSVIANITTDENSKQYYLCYVWLGGTRVEQLHSGEFYGVTMLHLAQASQQRKLYGKYFTDRTPHQTKGTVEVIWSSKQIIGSFS